MRTQQRFLALLAFLVWTSSSSASSLTATAGPLPRTASGGMSDVSVTPAAAAVTAASTTLQNGDQDKQGRVRRPPSGGSGEQQKPDAPRAVPRNDPQSRTEPKTGTTRDRDSARERDSVRDRDSARDQQDRDRDRAKPRTPPDRGHLPDRFFSHPREYAFLPVDVRLGFYYHPYFGFYYGPYYGPFYPYPGPFSRPTRYSASTIRLRVSPVETEVYINGYYAGIVDDFDGVFQRLYLPAGGHHLELRLVGYASYRQDVYVSPGDTLDVRHVMIRLAPGTNTAPPPEPGSLSPEWATAESDDRDGPPASPYGVLAVRTEPADAQIFIDGEAWRMTTAQQEFVLHLPAGWHRLEVRKDEYRTFTTTFESTPGHTTRLAVSLER